MNRTTICLFALCALTLAACGETVSDNDIYAPPAEYGQTDEILVTASKRTQLSIDPPSPQAPPGQSAPADYDARMLAYEYNSSLLLPAAAISTTLTRHENNCLSAGPSTCQVISSSIDENGEDYIYGNLEIRAKRDWLKDFRSALPSDASEANGRVTATSVRAEDLTRAITDTSARLDAQRTLRDRLLLLLEKDTDEVGDLLQIERELARVQGEIESADSYLRILEGRVSMDRMSLSYHPQPRAMTSQTTQPLVHAFTQFFGVLSENFGNLILFIASIIPWLLLVIPALWVLTKLITQWRKRTK